MEVKVLFIATKCHFPLCNAALLGKGETLITISFRTRKTTYYKKHLDAMTLHALKSISTNSHLHSHYQLPAISVTKTECGGSFLIETKCYPDAMILESHS